MNGHILNGDYDFKHNGISQHERQQEMSFLGAALKLKRYASIFSSGRLAAIEKVSKRRLKTIDLLVGETSLWGIFGVD